ncbi:MAG: AMP-binding protein [Gammaproteobacteria bacterium]
MNMSDCPALLWDCVERNAERCGDRVAIVHQYGRCTFGELRDMACTLARALVRLGIGPGDTVSYQLPNWIETLAVVLATLRIGAVANPIVPIYRRRELAFIVRDAATRVLFVPGVYRGFDHLALAREIELPAGVPVVACGPGTGGEHGFEGLLALGAPAGAPIDYARDPQADAFCIYTSGTTGNPKGVRHCQRGLMIEAQSYADYSGVDARSVSLIVSPITHITGITHAHFLPQLTAMKACMLDQWSPQLAIETIEREGCTLMGGATPFLQMLVDTLRAHPGRVPTLKLFRCGGAGVPPQLVRDAQALGIETVRCYGSTEHPTISGAAGGDPELAATTDGRVHDHVGIRIVDPADEQRVLALGEPGEIQSRGPELFLGYRDPSQDAEAFTADGWFRTGDIGVLDARRHVTIVGRKKDIIIRKGENISARDVEDALSAHPALAQVAVFGLPDRERGEMVAAAVVLRPGQQFDLARMAQFLDGIGLARRKFPERLEILDALPMTASGKIRKVDLQRRFAPASQ